MAGAGRLLLSQNDKKPEILRQKPAYPNGRGNGRGE
jgi:hypothetical protein